MSTDSSSELVAFHHFLGQQIQRGDTQLSPEASVRAYRAYCEELERFRQDLAPSLAEADRGEARPLDVDALMRRVNQRIEQSKRTD